MDDLSTLRESCKLYAVFADVMFDVTFKDAGESSSIKVLSGSRIGDLPNMNRIDNGDDFKHWICDGNVVNDSTNIRIHDNITIEAIYNYYVYSYVELI